MSRGERFEVRSSADESSATNGLDAERWQRLKAVMSDALELPPPERVGHLDNAALDDQDRQRIEAMIAAYDEDPDFLERPTLESGPPGDELQLAPGARLGDYRIVRKIGEGGMGEVYEAVQEQPIRRRVALKLMRPGHGQQLERFLAERQIMASMDHRHIARVFGAGTVAGRPYLAMELVHGSPITDYCDERRLSIDERLEIFISACQGVQHAHQRGIIHRDLKPSNILVAEEDGRPVPKVIDFGISKATEDASALTQEGQWLGTPDYMSPEQALDGSGLDTRSDVYSLGVVLYELLTGTLPFSTTELRQRGLDVLVRALRHEPPTAPSARWLEEDGRSLGDAAATRDSEPAKLGQRLRGDLDWVIFRALEKRPSDRYDSPLALARDLRRHLEHRPLEAARSSPLYGARKFYRRHRLTVAVGAAVLLLTTAGVVGTAFGLVKARQAERQARQQAEQARTEAERANREAETARRVTDFMWGVFRAPDPAAPDRGADMTLRAVLDRGAERVRGELADEPLVKARLMNAIGQSHVSLGSMAEGRALLENATELLEELDGAENELAYNLNLRGEMHILLGDYEESHQLLLRSLAIYRQVKGPDHRLVGHVLHDIGRVLGKLQRTEEALAAFEQALVVKRKTYAHDHRSVIGTLSSIGQRHLELGHFEKALEIQQQTLDIQERQLGADHATLAVSLTNLSIAHRKLGQLAEAERRQRRALEIDEKAYGPDHLFVAMSLLNLGQLGLDRADCEGAGEDLGRARSIVDGKQLTPGHALLIEIELAEKRRQEMCAQPLAAG